MNCFAPPDWLIKEGKRRIGMRAVSLRPIYMYVFLTSAACLISAAAVAESIADVRAWIRLDDTGMARSLNMISRPRRSAEEATLTKEGTTFLLPLTPVISGTLGRLLLSVEDLELLAL